MITYRGYRLHDNALDHGHVHLYARALDLGPWKWEFIGTSPTLADAKASVDQLLEADDGR